MTSKTSDLMTQARNKLDAAQAAHKAGDTQLRDVLLRQAAIRFEGAGRPDMAVHCQSQDTKPPGRHR